MTLSSLTAELRDLLPRVNSHWQNYIAERLEADAQDAEHLAWALKWVRRFATIDDVEGPGIGVNDPEWAKANRPMRQD